ncbi:MAG: TolC family outer membrane protein [Gammaproteobacteria bacterium]
MSPITRAADLLEIYTMARESDPELRAVALAHQASQEVYKQARGGYLPAISFSYDHTETEQRIHDSDNVLFQTGRSDFPTDALVLSLTQPVFRYANYVRIEQAKAEIEQADAELARADQALILRVVEAYLGVLAARDRLDFLAAEQVSVEKQLALAEGREKAEVGRAADRLEAAARQAAVLADQAVAQTNLDDAYRAVYELTGETPSELAPLTREFPLTRPDPDDVQHWLDAAREQNREIAVQRHAVEVARQEVRRQGAGHLPTVDLQLREGFRDQGGTVFGGGSEVETRDLMVNVNVPLYAGGTVSAKRREAVLRHQGELEKLTGLARRIERDTQRTFNAIVASIARIEALNKQIVAQDEVLRLKKAGYEAALYSNLSVLDAERDLYAAKRDYAAARYEYLLNGLRLKAAIGTLSEADLAVSNGWLEP